MAIKLNDGSFGPGGDLLHYPIYDRAIMLSTVLKHVLFKNAVNDTREGRVLTFSDTNITKGDSVPKSQKWTFWRMRFFFMTVDSAKNDGLVSDVLLMIKETVIRFNFESKQELFVIPLWKFFGPLQILSQPAGTINSRYPMGVFDATWEFKIPIVMESLSAWELDIEHIVAPNSSMDGDFLGFEFDGERARQQ